MPTVAEIAAVLNLSVRGDGSRTISGVASLNDAGPDDLSVLGSKRWIKQFFDTKAAAVIVHQKVKLPNIIKPAVMVCDDPDAAFVRVMEMFLPPIPRPAGIDPTASVSASAVLGEGCALGHHVVIGERTQIGANCIFHSGVFIGPDVTIGDHCEFFPNVVIRERISIGSRVIIHAGSVLGSDGFGYRWDGKKHSKVPQIGRVIIEDDVEIGSCTCIDRAKTGTTRIGKGTKIDNLVQIGHNVQVGRHCIIAGFVGLAGSVKLGTGVVMGGQSAVRDHVSVGDGVMVAGSSVVWNDVPAGTMVSGTPALPHRQSLREHAALRDLPVLRTQVRKMQEQLDQLKRDSRRS